MKLLQINSVYNQGSTGKIVSRIHQAAFEKGIDSYVIYSRKGAFGEANKDVEKDDHVFCVENVTETKIHVIKSILFDKHGLYSPKNTKNIIEIIDGINPDIVHLHNIHGYYLNYEMLFDYFKRKNTKVVWTLHDCWSFTGYCSHYDGNNCMKWQTGCRKCQYRNVYPYRVISNSENNFIRKKNAFDLNNLMLVPVSEWLKEELKKSFFMKKNIRVIKNDVNLDCFYPKKVFHLREKYKLNNKKVILSVASPFSKRKGFNDFIKLSKLLDDNYRIVLVGLKKSQIKYLTNNMIGITRTNSVEELNDWYNTADLLVNLTYEDTYPSVNLEAKAVGLPILGYSTGGSTEIIKGYGKLVPRGDIKSVAKEIPKMNYIRNPEKVENHMLENYLSLYFELTNK